MKVLLLQALAFGSVSMPRSCAHGRKIEALVKDLMISVTGFFRDEEAWNTLDETVITPLIAARQQDAASVLGASLRYRRRGLFAGHAGD
jgi:hypothetical protein